MPLGYLSTVKNRQQLFDAFLRIVGSSPHVTFHAGEVIVNVGDISKGVYVVRHGLVEMISPVR